MDTFGLFIGGGSAHGDEIRLVDLLACIDGDGVKWSILYLWSQGNLSDTRWGTYLKLEKAVQSSPTGVRVSWDDLYLLDEKLGQIYGLTVIGSRHAPLLRKYDTEDEMYAACEYVVEAWDNGDWEVHTSSSQTAKCLLAHGFPKIRDINT